MAEPLKNIYNDLFFVEFTTAIKTVVLAFDEVSFVKDIKNENWQTLELKGRMRHIATRLYLRLNGNYNKKISQLLKIIKALPAERSSQYGSLAYMLIPDLIEQYGLEEPQLSLKAMEKITQLTSCEFAIRPFLIRYKDLVMAQMLSWSTSSNYKLRRFSSEGCRPRLPWAMGVPALKEDPSLILPILENLRDDPSEFVRRSVANNLNDISKDHPDLVLKIAKQWYGQAVFTDGLVRHACRGLLKKGNQEALAIFDTGGNVKCKAWELEITPTPVAIGEKLAFSFKIALQEKKQRRLRLEYAVHYRTASGNTSVKIFKIAERLYAPFQTVCLMRNLSFKDLTTRKHYAGTHTLTIIVNGKKRISQQFLLT